MRATYGRPLVILLVIAGLVLLIACANIANLLLADATLRAHELSLRKALGASRWRVARQLLLESLLLAGSGALAGLGVSYLGSRLLVRQLSTQNNAVFLDLAQDWRVLGFTAIISALTVLLFGLAPMLRASRAEPIASLQNYGRGGAMRRRGGLRDFFLVAQVAFSFVLVVAAGLFVGTLTSLATKDLGFERDPVLLAHLNFQGGDLEAELKQRLYERIEESVRATPGVEQAALSSITPVSGMVFDVPVEIENRTVVEGRSVAYINALTPGWFATYGTEIVAGRDFDSGDRSSSQPVTIVNEAFVRKFLHGTDPIGARLRNTMASDREQADWMEIVGVASDAAYVSVRDEPPPTLYVPMAQAPEVTLSVRVKSGDPSRLSPGIAQAVGRINRDVAITFLPLKEQVDAALVRERVVAILSGLFGVVALLLAGMGLYGVTSYVVNSERPEIGIRIALGAEPGRVVGHILSRASGVVGVGILIGLAASVWLSKLVAPLLYGLRPADPTTLISSAAILGTVAIVSVWRPARRAAQTDPAEVLREG